MSEAVAQAPNRKSKIVNRQCTGFVGDEVRTVRKVAFVLGLIFLAALALAARGWNLHEVFVQGRIYFVDGDCYSRMTRARMILGGSSWSIRHHDFENFPA